MGADFLEPRRMSLSLLHSALRRGGTNITYRSFGLSLLPLSATASQPLAHLVSQ